MAPLRRCLCLAAAGLLLAAAAPWEARHLAVVASVEPGADPADLRLFDAVVGEATLVGLGEPTHGTREASLAKDRLVRHLAEGRGELVLGLEVNLPEAARLDAWVQGGAGDPRALVKGLGFWTVGTEEVLTLVTWMREWNERGRGHVSLAGFDAQDDELAAAEVRAFVAEVAPEWVERVDTVYRGVGLGSHFVSSSLPLPIEAVRGRHVVYAGWMKTEAVEGWAGLWCRADAGGRAVAFDNMAARKLDGTRPWGRLELALDVPAGAEAAVCGALLVGSGSAWFDDFELRADGAPVEGLPAWGLGFEGGPMPPPGPGAKVAGRAVVEGEAHEGRRSLKLERRAGLPLAAEAEALRAALEAAAPGWRALRGDTEVERVLERARVVVQAATIREAEAGGNRERDQIMAENVERIRAAHPGATLVLWAHNGHLRRTDTWMRWLGGHLAARHGEDYRALGFAAGEGEYLARSARRGEGSPRPFPLAPPRPGSLEAALAPFGPMVMIDLRRGAAEPDAPAWLDGVRRMRSIGARATPAPFQWDRDWRPEAWDLVWYLGETTAARRL